MWSAICEISNDHLKCTSEEHAIWGPVFRTCTVYNNPKTLSQNWSSSNPSPNPVDSEDITTEDITIAVADINTAREPPGPITRATRYARVHWNGTSTYGTSHRGNVYIGRSRSKGPTIQYQQMESLTAVAQCKHQTSVQDIIAYDHKEFRIDKRWGAREKHVLYKPAISLNREETRVKKGTTQNSQSEHNSI